MAGLGRVQNAYARGRSGIDGSMRSRARSVLAAFSEIGAKTGPVIRAALEPTIATASGLPRPAAEPPRRWVAQVMTVTLSEA